jgi:type II secretory pathway pseudopilin PulG
MPRRKAYVSNFSPRRSHRTDVIVILIIGIVFSVVAVYYFTTRTYAEEQQKKACLFLEQIYRLEQAHFEQYGAYLPIDRNHNAYVLKLDGVSLYEYRVEVPDSTSFIATTWADLNGDGKKDVWVVDQNHPTPFQKE